MKSGKGFAFGAVLIMSNLACGCGNGTGSDSNSGSDAGRGGSAGASTTASGGAGTSASGGAASASDGCPTSPDCQTCLKNNCASQLRGLTEEGQAQNDFNTVAKCVCALTSTSGGPGGCEAQAHAQLYFPLQTCGKTSCPSCGY